ncbi:ABC transporter permease [Clostridium cadaveris]|uniref:ABC transporter permease n=1 Tax=Clostridium cadaveris TaxID=1529 RepID=UPI000411B8A1|nr:ABC transporter permease [Clostridium cadaveris]
MRKFLRWISQNFILILILMAISLFFSLGLSKVKNFSELAYENEYYIGNNCIELSIDDFETSYKEVITSIMDNGRYNLFNTRIPGQSYSANGIYLNENLKVVPSLIRGRFFTKDDFSTEYKESLVVIGKGLLDKVEKQGEDEYIFFNEKRCKVIGVMGDEKKQKMLDYTLIFNLKDFYNTNQYPKVSNGWYLSSKDKSSDLYEVIDKANESMGKNSNTRFTVSKHNIQPNPIKTALKGTSNITTYFGCFAIVIALNIFIIVKQWIGERIKEIGVRKAFGASDNQIYKLVFKEYMEISLFSSLVALLIQGILIKSDIFDISGNIAFLNFVAITIFSFIFSSILLLISIREINKIQVNNSMRGDV